MPGFDWIVVGGGLCGSALSYELAKAGGSVLLLERDAALQNATRYSYGGIAYWSGTTDLTRQLCQEGIAIHRQLTEELGAATQFREIDLLMPIAPDRDPTAIAALYAACAIPPQVISAAEACQIEPLLDRNAIAAALHIKHGHVDPECLVKAYQQEFLRQGGVIQIAEIAGLLQDQGRITGVMTPTETWAAHQVVICAGAMSRGLLRSSGLPIQHYFTQAELIETAPVDLRLQSLIMPAEPKRFAMEAIAGQAETDGLWDESQHELVPPVLDVSMAQFLDGRLRIGQISRCLSQIAAPVDAVASETTLRQGIGQFFPTVRSLPGRWYRCQVAFSRDHLPLVGALPACAGVQIFSGFSNPFALVPPIARRFAQQAIGQADPVLKPLAPTRWQSEPGWN
jgi:glycine/D-amino acid oxidase-like deaminating enzyme